MIGFVGAGISIVAVTYGLARYVYGLFLPQIQSELALTTPLMGMIASSSYIGYLVATIIGIYITAITGPRFPIMMGGFAATIGMGIIAFSQSGWMLAIGVFIAGASPGFSYPPISDAIVQTIASANRSRIYSWINAGTSYGIII